MSDKTITTSEGHSVHMIEGICDAFGKGFDQAIRKLSNPYKENSDWWHAYRYGKSVYLDDAHGEEI